MNEFEKELNDQEKDIARVIGRSLCVNHRGKERAITAKKIIEAMRPIAVRVGVSLHDANIRKMVQWLRVSGECTALCSITTGGYYIARTTEEFRECCDSLRYRMANQYKTERALRKQLNEIQAQAHPQMELDFSE